MKITSIETFAVQAKPIDKKTYWGSRGWGSENRSPELSTEYPPPLRRKFIYSKTIDTVIVKLTTDDGLVGWGESKYKLHNNPEWVVFGKGYDKVQAFRSKLENFAGAIKGDEDLLIKPSDALASVEVIEAAYKSLNQNLWQKVVEKSETAKN